MSPTDHGKTVGMMEVTGTGNGRYVFFPSVDQLNIAIRFSRDGLHWTDPVILQSGVNAGPQLVRAGGKLLAFNNLYPERSTGTRTVVKIPDWVYQQTGAAKHE